MPTNQLLNTISLLPQQLPIIRPFRDIDQQLVMPSSQIPPSIFIFHHVSPDDLVQNSLMVRLESIVIPPVKVLVESTVMNPVTYLSELEDAGDVGAVVMLLLA